MFGPAATVSGLVQQRGALGTDIEDTFSLQYRTESGAAGQLTVLMASPQVARRGWAAGDNGFVYFDLLTGVVDRQLPTKNLEDSRKICDWGETLESVYRNEISTFISAIDGACAMALQLPRVRARLRHAGSRGVEHVDGHHRARSRGPCAR